MHDNIDKKNLRIPSVIFGTSGLGNLFVARDEQTKLDIIEECVKQSEGKVFFDSAGKYGAGLALETLGKCLKQLKVKPKDVIISNKLGWLRTELKAAEPTFEPGVWKELMYDAVQDISYDGIIRCFEQGNQLLNGYIPQWVSVHDPDEYLNNAKDREHEKKLYRNIVDAYKALSDLKVQGKVQAIGVGAKDWKAIRRIVTDVQLDWVMIANSMTIKKHPAELIRFMKELDKRGISIINSAVFHSGFLIGTNYFDYKFVKPTTAANKALFKWREKFFKVCHEFDVKPAEACVQFALNVPGVVSVALNTTEAKRVKENIEMAYKKLSAAFWERMKQDGLLEEEYEFV